MWRNSNAQTRNVASLGVTDTEAVVRSGVVMGLLGSCLAPLHPAVVGPTVGEDSDDGSDRR